LELTIDPVLDITGYKNVVIEWEGFADGPFGYCGLNVDLIDTSLGTGDHNLALQAEDKSSPSTASIEGAKNWGAIQLTDFNYKIDGIKLANNTLKDSSNAVIQLANRTTWKIKSIKFTK